MNQKRAAIYTLHGEDSCASIRLLSPLSAAGLEVYKPKPQLDIDEAQLAECDLIIIQRNYPILFTQYTRVMKIARNKKIPVLFEIDDFLFDLPQDHIERLNHVFTEGLLPMLQALVEADCVTVPTAALRNKLVHLNPNITVIPNYLDDRLWRLREPTPARNDTRLVIGYMGTETHKPDLEFLVPAFSELENKYPGRLTFRFWGISKISAMSDFESVDYVLPINRSYARFAESFQSQYADIFVAPLIDNVFNRCKSPIKFFEYTALGVPGIYSDYEPYQVVISQGCEGYLAGSTDEWFQYLDILVSNPAMRNEIAIQAQKSLQANWLLSFNASKLHSVYGQLAEPEFSKKNGENDLLELVTSLNDQYQKFANKIKQKAIERETQLEQKVEEVISLQVAYQSLSHEISQKNQQVIDKESLILLKEEEITSKNSLIHSLSFELSEIKVSKVWKIALILRRIRMVLAPPGSGRAKLASKIFHFLQGEKIRLRSTACDMLLTKEFDIKPINQSCGSIPKHTQSVDVIICIHNALEDVHRCLEAVVAYSAQPYKIILVDDGSDRQTKEFLDEWSTNRKGVRLIRNEQAQGYTLAANIGMRASEADFLVLLNSDTIVSYGWLDRLCMVMDKDPQIGVVGPLSNTASWQSIPELSENGDWATNPLPQGLTVEKMAELVAKYSGCIHPEVPLLNGFCLMIRKKALEEIGVFDEENFSQGYGEEDDFNIRAEEKGWKKVIADDVYVFHAQSKSYSSDRRYQLSRISGAMLAKKHGSETIARHVAFMNPNRVMEGIRARTRVMFEREEIIKEGSLAYGGKRVLFVLPVIDAGGGANVILDEARCMQKMGVDVQAMNLPEYKHAFLQNYRHSSIPFIFDNVDNLKQVVKNFDAVIATAHYSVPWLKQLEGGSNILGYYVQDFETMMQVKGSPEEKAATDSYTLIDGMCLFTKTNWTKQQVQQHTGAICDSVGISVSLDLMRPRNNIPLGESPVRIGAMIRPSSPYRSPEMTTKILLEIKNKFGDSVQVFTFGSEQIPDLVASSTYSSEWHHLGKLTQLQVAALMSQLDVFADFSSHQAMGLSALEAMASGATVIVPENGGAVEFVRHRENGMVVDTSSYQESLQGLVNIIENDQLRKQLQLNAIRDVAYYFPEKAAFNILRSLFSN